METQLTNIRKVDLQTLRKECKELFLKHHPEMRGMKLSDSFMLCKVIEFYLKA